MIDGVSMRLGDKDYIVPPLNLKSVKALLPKIETINGGMTQYQLLPLIAELAVAALQRNYPDITADSVEDMLDMGNAQKVMQAILGQSGFAPAGEPKPVSESPSTGTTSTAS